MKKEQNIQEPQKQALNIPVVRQRAMLWWNSLRLTERVVEMNKFGIEPYRCSDSLTESEVQAIYDSLHVA